MQGACLTPDLIEGILPANEIHLLAGPTGAGKTRWLFQTLIRWQAGQSILGHHANPVSWVYVASDRTSVSAKRTLDSMKIDPSKIEFIAAWDKQLTLNQIIDHAEGSHLIVIESFGSFVDHPATSTNVKRFMQAVSKMIRDSNQTIIGVMESPKQKPKERYGNPRQRISGVASWGHFAETVMLVEPVPGDESCPDRTVHICPRNGPEVVLELTFRSDGRLHPRDTDS